MKISAVAKPLGYGRGNGGRTRDCFCHPQSLGAGAHKVLADVRTGGGQRNIPISPANCTRHRLQLHHLQAEANLTKPSHKDFTGEADRQNKTEKRGTFVLSLPPSPPSPSQDVEMLVNQQMLN